MQYVFNVSGIYAAQLTLIPPFTHRNGESKKYYNIGKLIPRLVHPFLPVHQLLYYGSLLYMLQNAEDDEFEYLQAEYGSEIESM